MSTIRKEIFDTVAAVGPITAQQVKDLCPHLNPNSISSGLHYMVRKGILNYKKVPPSDDAPWVVRFEYSAPPGGPTPKYRTHRRKAMTPVGRDATLAELQSQVAELRRWKEDAIARYPDLGVDPLVAQARKLVAAEVEAGGDKHLADTIRAGQKDGILPMRIALKALGVV